MLACVRTASAETANLGRKAFDGVPEVLVEDVVRVQGLADGAEGPGLRDGTELQAVEVLQFVARQLAEPQGFLIERRGFRVARGLEQPGQQVGVAAEGRIELVGAALVVVGQVDKMELVMLAFAPPAPDSSKDDKPDDAKAVMVSIGTLKKGPNK